MKAINRFKAQEGKKIWSRYQAEQQGLVILTVAEYAKATNYAIRTVQEKAQCGKLNAFKQGGFWFIAVKP